MQGWYKTAGEQQAKKYHDSMEKQTVEREELYTLVPPPGDPIPCNMEKTLLNDRRLFDHEISVVVKDLRNNLAGNTRGMQAEDLKQWLSMIESKDKADAARDEEHTGRGNTWRIFVKLVQHVWDTGNIP